jgi:hypothetical protein
MADGEGALERVHNRAFFQSLKESLERYSFDFCKPGKNTCRGSVIATYRFHYMTICFTATRAYRHSRQDKEVKLSLFEP